MIFQIPFTEERLASFNGLVLPVHDITYDRGRADVVNIALSDLVAAFQGKGEEDAALFFNGIDEYVRASRSAGGNVPTIGFDAERGLLISEDE